MNKYRWYRAFYITGVLDFRAKDLAHANKLSKKYGAEHYPGERCVSVATLREKKKVAS